MSKIRLFVSQLGIDGWIFTLAALASIAIGILDFTPVIKLTDDPTQKTILIALGLTMAAVVAQTSRRSAEFEELRKSFGVPQSELIEEGELDAHIRRSILRSKKFVQASSTPPLHICPPRFGRKLRLQPTVMRCRLPVCPHPRPFSIAHTEMGIGQGERLA